MSILSSPGFSLPRGELKHIVDSGTVAASTFYSKIVNVPAGQQIVVFDAILTVKSGSNLQSTRIYTLQPSLGYIEYRSVAPFGGIYHGFLVIDAGHSIIFIVETNASGSTEYNINMTYLVFPEPRIA